MLLALCFFNSAFAVDSCVDAKTDIKEYKSSTKEYKAKLHELETFVRHGLAYIHKYGKEKAYKDFNNPNGKFVKGQLYFFVYTYQGVNVVYGSDPKAHVGKNYFNFRDMYGTTVVKMVAKVAKQGGGFVHYYWLKPGTNNDIEYKTSYVLPIDDKEFIGAGIYENIEVPIALEIQIEELKAFVREAKEYYRINGEKAAFAEFSNLKGKFNHGNKYVFVGNYDGVLLANGANDDTVVGKSYLEFRDEFGTPFVLMFIEAAKNGGGVVSYYWVNPETKKLELKTAYVEPLTDNTFIGSGIYGS